MISPRRHKYWMCPFFMYDLEAGVVCEQSKLILPDKLTANKYQDRYCANGDWEDCTIAKALWERYEEQDVKKSKQIKK